MIRCARCVRTAPVEMNAPVGDDGVHLDFEPESGEEMPTIEVAPDNWVTVYDDDSNPIHLCPAHATPEAIEQYMEDAETIGQSAITEALKEQRERGGGEDFDFDQAEDDLTDDEQT